MAERELPINFNVRVRAELTAAGKRMRAAYYHRLGMDAPTSDTITEPLWELFSVFGRHIFMGMPEMPFKGNTLTLLLEDGFAGPVEEKA